MIRNESNRARFGPYTHKLWKFGTRLKLVGQPFEILAMLLRRPGELVTREEMRSRLWPSDTFVDFNHGLNAAVNRLREALSDSAEHPRYIETLPRRGYRFIGQVEWLNVTALSVGPNSVPASPVEPQPMPNFTLQPELSVEAAPVLGTWHRYLIGVGALFSLLMIGMLFIRPVSPFSEARSDHAVVEHTRSLLSISDTSSPAFSPDGNYIAFYREHSNAGESGIYVIPVGDDNPLQLTHNKRDCCPVWSPDGHFIAFARQVNDSYSIHIVAADGGGDEKRQAEKALAAQSVSVLIRRAAVQATAKALDLDHEVSTRGISPIRGAIDWSPDGKLIAFAASDGIYVLSRDDSTVRRITEAPQLTQDWGPTFSPDGKTVLFVRDHQADLSNEILSVSVDGGDRTHIFSERGKVASPPKWSYDGRSVIFSSNRTGHPALWRISLDSPTEAVQVDAAGSPAWDPAISRRGYRLAFERLSRSLSIWQIDLTSPDKRPYLAVSSTSDTDQGPGPQFSPDGRKLAYMSDRSGTMEIWIANRDGRNPFQLRQLVALAHPAGRLIAKRWSSTSARTQGRKSWP